MDEQLLESVEKARLRIRELEQEIAKVKESLRQNVVIESPETVAKLYWADNLEGILNFNVLMEISGMKQEEIRKIAQCYPHQELFPCYKCGEPFLITSSSKSALKELRKVSSRKHVGDFSPLTCPACLKKEDESIEASTTQ